MHAYQMIRNSLLIGILFCGACVDMFANTAPTYQWVKLNARPGDADQQLASCTLSVESTPYSEEESADGRKERLGHWVDLCMRSHHWELRSVSMEPSAE